jgi:hypothetical protein
MKNSKMKNRKRCKKYKSKRKIRSLYIKIFMYEKLFLNLRNEKKEIFNENCLLNFRVRDMNFNIMQLNFKIDNQQQEITTLNQYISFFQILAQKAKENIDIISLGKGYTKHKFN